MEIGTCVLDDAVLVAHDVTVQREVREATQVADDEHRERQGAQQACRELAEGVHGRDARIEPAQGTSVHRDHACPAYPGIALSDLHKRAAPPPVVSTLALLALCLPIAMTIASFALVVVMRLDGTASTQDSMQDLRESGQAWIAANFATPKGVLALMVPMQLTFLALALVPALVSRTPFAERLALRKPRLRASTFVLLLAGTVGVQVLVETVGEHVLGAPSEALRRMAELIAGSDGAFFVVLLLGASLVPGFAEELFFRGYVQSRLVARYGAAAGMLLPTLVFALAHGDPQHILLVAWIGVWLAYVAWRASSTWVSIACHASNNFFAVLITRGVGIGPEGSLDAPWFLYAGGAVGLACAGIAVLRLERAARVRPEQGSTDVLDAA